MSVLYPYVCARACVPSASRNARVPPKLRWLPSAKMAARIPQSDSTRREEQECEEKDVENGTFAKPQKTCCEREETLSLRAPPLQTDEVVLFLFLSPPFWHADGLACTALMPPKIRTLIWV